MSDRWMLSRKSIFHKPNLFARTALTRKPHKAASAEVGVSLSYTATSKPNLISKQDLRKHGWSSSGMFKYSKGPTATGAAHYHKNMKAPRKVVDKVGRLP